MPIYFELYALLQQYIFGMDTVLTPYMELTLTQCATIGSLFLCSLPFLIVWRLIKVMA